MGEEEFVVVSRQTFYERFVAVETMAEENSPVIVRVVRDHTAAIAKLDFRVNVILSGLAAGVLGYAGIVTKGLIG